MGTKKGRIPGKGAPFEGASQTFGRGSCIKHPPGFATGVDHEVFQVLLGLLSPRPSVEEKRRKNE